MSLLMRSLVPRLLVVAQKFCYLPVLGLNYCCTPDSFKPLLCLLRSSNLSTAVRLIPFFVFSK